MTASHKVLNGYIRIYGFGISSLALAICMSSLPAAAQEQTSQNAPTVHQDDRQPISGVPALDARSTGQDVPSTITLPAGTMIPVRINVWLSSDKNKSGDRFSASLEQPLVANGCTESVPGFVLVTR